MNFFGNIMLQYVLRWRMCLGVTLSVYPHRAYRLHIPTYRGQADFQPSGEDIYTLRVTPQTHSAPEYITQTTKNKTKKQHYNSHLSKCSKFRRVENIAICKPDSH